MRRLGTALSLALLFVAAPAFATTDATVSVGIFSGRRISACNITACAALKVDTSGAVAELPAGTTVRLTADGALVKSTAVGDAARIAISSTEPIEVTPDGLAPRSYRGSLVITAREGRLTLVNAIALEDYLRGVVPAEVPSGFAPEALKAQAIAARTYALASLGKHKAAGFDLCDTTHCQAYLGVGEEDPRVDAAIRDTVGLTVTYEGKPINAVYHDTCGGCTAGNDEVWPGGTPLPYLRPVPDTCGVPALCAASPRARWTRRIPQEKLVAALASVGVTAPLKLIAPEGCEDGTRPDRYRVTGENGEWVVPAAAMRARLNQAVGPDTLPSADFIALLDGDSVAITGWGSGHGVGLCQWGANALAKSGQTAAEILAHYYTGASVSHQ